MELRTAIMLIGLGWFRHLGLAGLIAIGILDQSFVPIPGGMDALTIILAASHRSIWPLVALIALAGALLGAFLTYSLSKKGGKEALEKRFPRRKIKAIEKKFEEHGFSALFIPALLPPPLPMVPFLVGAGALQYPTKKFFAALGSGRAIRYFLVAYLGQRYGEAIMGFFSTNKIPIIIAFAILSVGASVGGYFYAKWQKKREGARQEQPEPQEHAA
jgi:membrane protein DedA with SNARE-associated domain